MACTTDDAPVQRRSFIRNGSLSILNKALHLKDAVLHPQSPHGESPCKEQWRWPGSPASTCLASEDSDGDTPKAAESIDRILSTMHAELWHSERYDQVSRLQEAVRNQGSVELMNDKECFGKVAVKKMPNTWMQTSAAAFATVSPSECEQPWFDVAVVQWLNEQHFPYSVEFHGIFQDDTLTYVVFELATEGDLIHFASSMKEQGDAREKAIRPVTQKLCSAMAWLHDLGIAHGDISLENVLLTKNEQEGDLKVKLIDFGMSTTHRRVINQDRGKPMYQAPEMHVHNVAYDPFLADVFAVGVTFFCMATQEYPWASTTPGRCQYWHLMVVRDLRTLLGRKKPRQGKQGQFLLDVLSLGFIELLEGMLAVKPNSRLTFGEFTWSNVSKKSVWDMAWMKTWDA